MRRKNSVDIPEMDEIVGEMKRTSKRTRYYKALRATIYTLVVVAAAAILIATLWLPFLRIYGTSMAPTLEDGEIICCIKTADFERGDVIAFYYNNKILVKRVIGKAGDWIEVSEDGTVYVNEIRLDEPYLTEKALGECDIEMPYQVPDGQLFVMGDHRSLSIDSRHSTVGCISSDMIVGKLWLRLWPINKLNIF